MRLSLITLLVLSVIDIMAQTIRGRLIDDDGMPVGYANVVLLTADSVFIDGAVTSDNGEFIFHKSAADATGFRLKVSCIGYETLDMGCRGDSIGDILMRRQANMLSEVFVTPSTYRMKGNSLIVSIQNSALSHLDDVGKMLEFLPGLQYNDEGLYVFGKGKPLVYLNGRLLHDSSELERLKSSDIATVEIIRNPGARYAASAQAVVKIKTVPKKGEGLGMDLKSYFQLARKTRVGETLQVNYRHAGLDIFAYLNYLKANDVTDEHTWYDIVSSDPFRLQNFRKDDTGRNRYIGKAGFDYWFTQRQNIGAYYSCTYHDIDGNIDEIATVDEYSGVSDSQTYHTKNKLKSPIHCINAYYSGRIGPFDINFNNDLYRSDNRQSQTVEGMSDIHGIQTATTSNRMKYRLAASDLTLGYKKGKSVWSLGTALNYIRRTNDYTSSGGIDLSELQKISERKWAVYGGYEINLNGWDMEAGLRYEHYRFDYYRNENHITNQSKTYRNLYPALSIARPAGNVNLSLSYSSKSKKPQYNVLDGNIQYLTRNLYRGGNPQLKPSNIHDLQLSMLFRELTVSVDYIRMKNPIYHTYRFYNPEQTVILATYDNYPKINLFQAQASYTRKFGIWRPQLTVECLKGDYRFEQAGRIYRQDKPLFTFNLNHTLTLPRQWYVYLYALFRTDGCDNDGVKMAATGRLSLYVVKRWRNFSFDILFNDITRSYKTAYSAISPACTYNTSRYLDTQNIQINIRYHFNTSRSKYKGTNAAAEEFNRM